MGWLFLAGAILVEVCATLSLRMATTGRKAWYAIVITGYLLAFVFLTLTLHRGIGIGVAYGVWAAVGVALTAIASRVFFKEPLTRTMGVGIGCIMAGVLLVELGGAQ
ncbi:MAG TPA: SMR family transporter [Pseudonocardiaceae bacterium]|nr:SMR family transporter [Pseudonocardiaceae bacterium]